MLNNIKTKQKGFTIVELLIVIVIIAILAAITIVAYNGITNRANSSSATAAANSLSKKAEAFNAETTENGGGSGVYPTASNIANLTAAANSSKTYYLTGVNVTSVASNSAATGTAKPGTPNSVLYQACGTAGAGARIWYWQYDGTAGWVNKINNGDTSACS